MSKCKSKCKRRDRNRVVLRKGESQRKDGRYDYRWTSRDGKRHSIYALSLDDLRERERDIQKDQLDGIRADAQYLTVKDLFERWVRVKRGLKENTLQNYKYLYWKFINPAIGAYHIRSLVKSNIRAFYNALAEKRNLRVSTIDSIHTVLHQILDLAVDDNLLRNNPSNNVLRELKKSHEFDISKRHALSLAQQKRFLSFLSDSPTYSQWYPIFAIMIGSGLRVGEITGLRWCDVDLKNRNIDINHTLVYFQHSDGKCYYSINRPKTVGSVRKVPMLGFVREAFLAERKHQFSSGIRCTVSIDGYTDFVFINSQGKPLSQGFLNKLLRRIVRDCNVQSEEKKLPSSSYLPVFSCHILRHTFTTRMCEAGINIKVIQDSLGHSDISTTMNIYADATSSMKHDEFQVFEKYLLEKGP